MPTIRQLEYLVALSQELHFRRAAEKLNVTQPTLSAQLQQLERRLKTGLVERGKSSVMMTPVGLEVVARAKTVLAQIQDIRDLASASQHGFHGTIRLGVPPTLGPYLLPHIVPHLHTAHPLMKLYVREQKPATLVEQLLTGTHDVIIAPTPLTSSDLVSRVLFREPLRLVCAPDHPLASKGSISKQDLAGEQVLAMESGHHLHNQVSRICEDHKAVLLRDYEGTSLDTLRLMVGMGVGIAFLPVLYIRSEIGPRKEINVLDLALPGLHRQIALAWRQSSVHAPLFEDMASLITDIARKTLSEFGVSQ